MLYLSTGNKAYSFTAHRVLRSDAPDGGVFMPMQIPVQSDAAMAEFSRMTFGEAVAAVLNCFFGCSLTGWDVDFAIGRQAVDLVSAGGKIYISECWHNPAGTQEYLTRQLHALMTKGENVSQPPNLWIETAVNIAVIFGLYGKCRRRHINVLDIAVDAGNLQLLLAVRYAQKMGLPVRKVILGCAEGDGLWDFLSYGEYAAGKRERNLSLEALLWLEFGHEEAAAYLKAVQEKTSYRLHPLLLEQLRRDLFVSVVGEDRVKSVIESSTGYRMEPGAAGAFGALQDYRAKTGENRNTILFALRMPK